MLLSDLVGQSAHLTEGPPLFSATDPGRDVTHATVQMSDTVDLKRGASPLPMVVTSPHCILLVYELPVYYTSVHHTIEQTQWPPLGSSCTAVVSTPGRKYRHFPLFGCEIQ